MKKLEYRIEIESQPNHVFNVMIDTVHLLDWMSVFSEDSSFEGSWEKGQSVIFKCPNEKGELCGLICKIEEFKENELIYLQPIGIEESGKFFYEGEKVSGIISTYEKYIFNQKGNSTELIIDASAMDDHVEFFNERWPIALEKIKSICEGKLRLQKAYN